MTKHHHRPVRSCVGCGQRAAQADLLRFVAADGNLKSDADRRLPGRGAYLHPKSACWEAFVARKPLIKSLRRSVDRTARAAFIEQLRDTATR